MSKNLVYLLLSSIFVFCFSIYFSELYISGDQEHYIKTYKLISGLDLYEAFMLYNISLNSKEIVHFIYIYIGSNLGVSKFVWMSLSNVLLYICYVRFLTAVGFSLIISIFLVITNLYTYVLFFGAERLKFGFIFLFFFLYSFKNNNFKSSSLFVLLSIISHAQMMLYYVGIGFYLLFGLIINVFKYNKINLTTIISVVVSILALLIIFPQLEVKALSYIKNTDVTLIDFIKVIAFLFITIISSTEKKFILLFYIVIFLGVALFGSSRVIILTLPFFFYQKQFKTKYFNYSCFAISAYSLINGFVYLFNIIISGNGYGVIE